jgi:uncharacterized membrane protein
MPRATTKPRNPLARFGMAAAFTGIGALHFVNPEPFDAIVPDAVPAKRFWVYATGVAEVAGGVALAVRPDRKVGWLLTGLLLLVFPANINQAVQGIQLPGAPELPRWAMWARLPMQAVMIWAVLAGTRPVPGPAPAATASPA